MLLLGRIFAGVIGLLMLVNGAYMLVSPQAWFRLPPWLRAQGTLTREKYTSGWGALQVRFAGGAMVAVLVWVIYDMFISRA